VMLEAQGGSSEDARGLLFAWRRQGDVADACQDVTVYLSGMARIGDCRGEQLQVIDQVWLTANQMSTLYIWVDSLQSFSVESDAATSLDGMPKGLFFIGAGQETASDFEAAYLTDLAEDLLTQAQTEPVQADIDTARVALEAYFSALAAGSYTEAAALYGGSTSVLEQNNPTLNPADRAALFQAACTLNGFVCNLNVLNFVHEAQLSASDFRFTVEFQNPDGSLFQLGPCCGADPALEPPWTQFDFIVHKLENGLFQVQDLPVYIP
jgi:hypothetical protein